MSHITDRLLERADLSYVDLAAIVRLARDTGVIVREDDDQGRVIYRINYEGRVLYPVITDDDMVLTFLCEKHILDNKRASFKNKKNYKRTISNKRKTRDVR